MASIITILWISLSLVFLRLIFRNCWRRSVFREVFPELERVMFDSGYMAKRVVLDEGKDLIRASANNYYMNVTQREVEEFYRTSGEEDSWSGIPGN